MPALSIQSFQRTFLPPFWRTAWAGKCPIQPSWHFGSETLLSPRPYKTPSPAKGLGRNRFSLALPRKHEFSVGQPLGHAGYAFGREFIRINSALKLGGRDSGRGKPALPANPAIRVGRFRSIGRENRRQSFRVGWRAGSRSVAGGRNISVIVGYFAPKISGRSLRSPTPIKQGSVV